LNDEVLRWVSKVAGSEIRFKEKLDSWKRERILFEFFLKDFEVKLTEKNLLTKKDKNKFTN